MPLIEEIGAELVIVDVISNDEVDGHENTVSDGDDCFIGTDPGPQTVVLTAEVGILGTAGSVRGLDEGCAKEGITLAGPPGVAFACAFMVAGAYLSPGCQVSRGREPTHVGANGRQDLLSSDAADAGDGDKTSDDRLGWLHAQLDFGVDLSDLVIEEINMGQLGGKH